MIYLPGMVAEQFAGRHEQNVAGSMPRIETTRTASATSLRSVNRPTSPEPINLRALAHNRRATGRAMN